MLLLLTRLFYDSPTGPLNKSWPLNVSALITLECNILLKKSIPTYVMNRLFLVTISQYAQCSKDVLMTFMCTKRV